MMKNPASRIRDFARHLVAGDDGTSLEQRLYRALCLVSAILMLVVVTPLNLVEHLSVFLDLTILAAPREAYTKRLLGAIPKGWHAERAGAPA